MRKVLFNKLIISINIFVFLCALLVSGNFKVAPVMAAEDDKIINVYLIGGQSNAVGYGMDNAATTVSSLDARYNNGFSNVLYYGVHERNSGVAVNEDFQPVKLGLGQTAVRSGAELGIASILGDTESMNAIIKCARGASYLYPDTSHSVSVSDGTWTSPSYIENNDINTDSNKIGNMYNRFIDTVKTGLKLLEEDGYTPVIKGMWWMQGEAESNSPTMADEYDELLTSLISDIRSDLSEVTGDDQSQLPFVIGSIFRNPANTPNSDVDTINEAQLSVASELHNVSVIDISKYPSLVQHDAWHFDAMTQRWIGQQFLEELNKFEVNKFKEIVVLDKNVEIRENEPSGLKFKAEIVNYDVNNNYKYGFLIIPTDYLDEVKGDYINYFEVNNIDVVNLACSVNSGDYDNDGTIEDYIQGSIVNIKYKNLNRKFTGIAYITDSLGNVTYSKASVSGSIANIAGQEIVLYENTDEKYSELLNYINGSINYENGVEEENKYQDSEFSIECETNVELNVGFDQKLNVTQTPSMNFAVKYVSADENIATVDEYGVIKATGVGETTISVLCAHKVFEVSVTVTDDFAIDGVLTYETKLS